MSRRCVANLLTVTTSLLPIIRQLALASALVCVSPALFAQAPARSPTPAPSPTPTPTPCSASDSGNAIISLVSAPPTLILKPDQQAWGDKATGHMYVRNDGTKPLSRLCVVAHLNDYREAPANTKVELERPIAQHVECSDMALQQGAIEDLLLNVQVDADRLPYSGMVVVTATGQGSVTTDTAANEKSSAGAKQLKNKKKTGDSASLNQPKVCTIIAKQALQPVTVTLSRSAEYAGETILITGVLAVLFLVVTLLCFHGSLGFPMGSSQWSFSSSAATNLTVLGGLLTSILVSSALPDYPHYMTKQTYIVLSLLFAIVAALAPVLYNFFCRPVRQNATNPDLLDFQGWVWLFLAADALTLWAVGGQLGTISLLFNEFAARQHISNSSANAVWGAATLVLVSLIYYCVRTADFYISTHPAQDPEWRKMLAAKGPQLLPRWTAP